MAPQNEKYDLDQQSDRFFKRENAAHRESQDFETRAPRQLKTISLPSTINKERRLKLEKREDELQSYKKKFGINQKDAAVVIGGIFFETILLLLISYFRM